MGGYAVFACGVPCASGGRIQLTSYGWGLLSEYIAVVLLRRRDPTIGKIREVPACPR